MALVEGSAGAQVADSAAAQTLGALDRLAARHVAAKSKRLDDYL